MLTWDIICEFLWSALRIFHQSSTLALASIRDAEVVTELTERR